MLALLTINQIELVQQSFKQVAPIATHAARLFYNKLFDADPQLKSLFPGDMEEQGKRLMAMIAAAVRGLNNIDALVPVVQELGRRHVVYGVLPEHYPKVGAALLWTLEQGLGEAFTPAVRDAWAAVYGLLASVMIDAACNGRVATASPAISV